MEEQEKLEIIAKYNELKPLYDLVIVQFKNELLQDANKMVNAVSLPNGTQMLFKKKKAFNKNQLNTTKLKAERPEIYNEFVEVKEMPESVTCEVLYPSVA